MTRQSIYLDHNASAPLLPEARAAHVGALDLVGNPSSVHAQGRALRAVIDKARAQVARLAGAERDQVVFTGSATEAITQAIVGGAKAFGVDAILVSDGEHAAVLRAAEATGLPVKKVGLDADGLIKIDEIAAALAAADLVGMRVLVAVHLANNETGVIQPLADVVRIAHAHGALVHCDAIQAAGRLPLEVGALGIDLMTLSAHKLGGPQGVGALIVRDGIPITPVLRGGGQEHRRRAGTENVAGIAGFGVAARLAREGLPAQAALGELRDDMERRLIRAAQEVGKPAVLYGRGAPRVANTTCVSMPGATSETQIMALDLAGIAVSAGSACSSGKVKPSHVLTAMGVPADEAASAIRVSLGWGTRAGDIDRFVEAWMALRRRTPSPAPQARRHTLKAGP
jgi:cysteine desulfurase